MELPAYALLDASGVWELGPTQLEAGVRNVLDRTYPEVRAGGFVNPGQPRTVFAAVRARLPGF